MKKSNLILAIPLLFVFISASVYAQPNKGGQGNGVDFIHHSPTFIIGCAETPGLQIFAEYYETHKLLPDGITHSNHYTVTGEGVDNNGVVWRMHVVENSKSTSEFDFRLETITMLHGSNGQKLKAKLIRRVVDDIIVFEVKTELCDFGV